MTYEDTPEWRVDLLRKIGGYGASDPRLLDIAAAICGKRPLTDDQRQYAIEFEARLEDSYSVRGHLT